MIQRVVLGVEDWKEAKICRCRRVAGYRKALSRVPPIFRSPKIATLRARPECHPSQVKLIAHVRANPDDSYLLTGRNGSGKTHVGWALYRRAVVSGRGVVACTVRDLLAEFRRFEVGTSPEILPPITAEQLRRSPGKWLLFLDEFEKARPSEFASEMLFNVLDAARSFNHQIVITSNLNWEDLKKHWGRQDEIWGNSIIERLKGCYISEMFDA